MMLALGIRYLTGYAVATDVSDRTRAEWPPHPARVYMALAAAHFETGGDPAERKALEWVEKQGPPAFKAGEPIRREVVTHFVPVNDKAGPSKMDLQSCPGLPRSKQPRTFPRVRLPDDTAYLLWAEATPDEASRVALDRLCRKVIRIGHSSSLVQMWVESSPPEANWSPAQLGKTRMRVVGEGTLRYLKDQFNADAIRRHDELGQMIDQAQAQKKAIKGKGAKARKAEVDEQIQRLSSERDGLDPRPPLHPVIGLWQAYRKLNGESEGPRPASGLFDRNLMVLALQDGPVVGLETTWQLLTALRDAILGLCDPTPEWISGHRPDGSPSQQPHLALLPLAFVGHPHADGHLLGVGLAFPKNITPRVRGAALRMLLYDEQGRPKPVGLKLGRLGAWSLVRETRESPPLALQSRTWAAPSRLWATVTPIVLDRHAKADYGRDRRRWQEEVEQIVAESCQRQGLPEPAGVRVDKICSHRGAPRAIPGKSGFALMPTKPGQIARQQVHARLWFDQDVEGPLLLGAGRYRGYGFCKPWQGGGQ